MCWAPVEGIEGVLEMFTPPFPRPHYRVPFLPLPVARYTVGKSSRRPRRGYSTHAGATPHGPPMTHEPCRMCGAMSHVP